MATNLDKLKTTWAAGDTFSHEDVNAISASILEEANHTDSIEAKLSTVVGGSGIAESSTGSGLTAVKTLNIVSKNAGIVVNINDIELKTVEDLSTELIGVPASSKLTRALNDNKAEKSTLIVAGAGLTGGGNLSLSSVSINVAASDPTIVVAEDGLSVNITHTYDEASYNKVASQYALNRLKLELDALDARINSYADILLEISSGDFDA